MRHYYNILGLSEGADKPAIKSAYRSLVKKYHPDLNPDPSAERIFEKIQEAYEILYYDKTPPNRPLASHRSRSQSTKQNENVHNQASRERFAKKDAKEYLRKEHQKNEAFFNKMTSGIQWKIFRIGSFIMAGIALLFILELFLPRHIENNEVVAYSKDNYRGFRGGTVNLYELKTGDRVWLENSVFGRFNFHPDCKLEKSWIFHSPLLWFKKRTLLYIDIPWSLESGHFFH